MQKARRKKEEVDGNSLETRVKLRVYWLDNQGRIFSTGKKRKVVLVPTCRGMRPVPGKTA